MISALLVMLQVAAANPHVAPTQSFGVEVRDMTRIERRYRGAPDGVLVLEVYPHSPADACGLEPGDVVIGVDHRPVRSPQQLEWRLDVFRGDHDIPMAVMRDGFLHEIAVDVPEEPWWVHAEEHHHEEALRAMEIEALHTRIQLLEAEMEELEEDEDEHEHD